MLVLAPDATPTARAVVLDPIPYRLIAERLQEAGRAEEEAERVAHASGGKLMALQRHLGYTAPPGWLRPSEEPALMAMLLVGAWEPRHEPDQDFLQRLRFEPRQVETVCTRLLSVTDAPMVRETQRWGREAFRWASPQDAWRGIGHLLARLQLRDFEQAASLALAGEDSVARCSQTLREGIALTLVMLTVHDEALSRTLGVYEASQAAGRVVRAVLVPGWQRWASLTDLLPLLAEAAPRAFLDAVETSLAAGEEGVGHLLHEEGHGRERALSGLLWALEGLGFRPDAWDRVATILARLAARDLGGQSIHRPIGSLASMLDPARPQSTTSVDQRVAALRRVLDEEPGVGWQLVPSMLPGAERKNLLEAVRPRYNVPLAIREGEQSPSEDEYRSQVSRMLDLLIERLDEDEVRWLSLLEVLPSENDVEARILDALRSARTRLPDRGGTIWGALREVLHRLHHAGLQDAQPRLARLASLYQEFTPSNLVLRSAWLFKRGVILPEPMPQDIRGEYALIEKRRAEVIVEIGRRDDRWEVLARLVQALAHEAPSFLGRSLAESSFAEDLRTRLMSSEDAAAFAPILPSFLVTRGLAKGDAWIDEVLRALLDQGKMHEAVQTATHLPQGAGLWDRIDQLGEPFRSEFWRRVQLSVGPSLSPEELDRAATNLIAVSRVEEALSESVMHDDRLLPETAWRVLEAIRANLDAEAMERLQGRQGKPREIRQLFAVLDRDPALDPQKLADIEEFFFTAFSGSSRKLLLYRSLADSPERFVLLIESLSMRGGSAVPGEAEQPARERVRGAAILHYWKGFPGEGLPFAEREERLLAWARKVIERLGATERLRWGISEVAKVLARVPSGPGECQRSCRVS